MNISVNLTDRLFMNNLEYQVSRNGGRFPQKLSLQIHCKTKKNIHLFVIFFSSFPVLESDLNNYACIDIYFWGIAVDLKH